MENRKGFLLPLPLCLSWKEILRIIWLWYESKKKWNCELKTEVVVWFSFWFFFSSFFSRLPNRWENNTHNISLGEHNHSYGCILIFFTVITFRVSPQGIHYTPTYILRTPVIELKANQKLNWIETNTQQGCVSVGIYWMCGKMLLLMSFIGVLELLTTLKSADQRHKGLIRYNHAINWVFWNFRRLKSIRQGLRRFWESN
jgi:hypothetical protein